MFDGFDAYGLEGTLVHDGAFDVFEAVVDGEQITVLIFFEALDRGL